VPEEALAPLTRPVFVIGHARHGKTVFREALAKELGVKGASCSDTIYTVWSLISGIGEEALRERPKAETRPLLVALGNWLTTPAQSFTEFFPFWLFPGCVPGRLDGGFLPKPSAGALVQFAWLNGVRVLDGIRREVELEDSGKFLRWSGVPPRIVWVANPRLGQEPGDNFSIPPSRASRIFLNDGTVEDLQEKARAFAKEILEESDLDA
jgi:hypothetical protein